MWRVEVVDKSKSKSKSVSGMSVSCLSWHERGGYAGFVDLVEALVGLEMRSART